VLHKYTCIICNQKIIDEKKDHDSAHHVAKAYHIENNQGLCLSCGKKFPCKTRLSYGGPIKEQ